MKFTLRSWEIVGIFILLVFFYYFLIRPWWREGRITLDGLLCLVFFFTIFWQDTLMNGFQIWVTYNASLINFGAWNPHILGWLSPRANLIAEPVIWNIPIYVYGTLGPVIVGCYVMRRAKVRWPHIGTVGLLATCFGFFVVFDLIAESLWMRLGFYAYPGSISWLTLFHGHYYQFPIYELVLAPALYTAWAACRHFRNDKGQTFAERGIDRVGVAGTKKTGLRFLALVGICNLIFVLYMIPVAIAGLYASPWPEDITTRSYFMDGICGPGTPYACSGPGIPIPRRNSAHLDPEGRLLRPVGAQRSGQAR
jgi:hypothetical protein